MINPREVGDVQEEWLSELHSRKIILDLGSGSPYQGAIKKERLSQGSAYYCMDYCPEYSPHIVGDIQALPFKDGSVDAIYCGAVLEHVPEPWRAMDEMKRVLKKDGLLLTYFPFAYPYHGCREYKDYYRFSVDGIEHLLRDFSNIKIEPSGGYVNTTLRFMAGFLSFQKHVSKLESFLSAFFNKFFSEAKTSYRNHFNGLAKTTTGYYVYARK